MSTLRTNPTLRTADERRSAWSWRARKQSESRVRELQLPIPPVDEQVTGELRVKGLAAEAARLVDCFLRRDAVDHSSTRQLAGTLIQFGLEIGARTIYFEPGASIRMRAPAGIRDPLRLPEEFRGLLQAVLLESAGLDPDSRRPQDGLLRVAQGEHRFQLRITCIPGVLGTVSTLHLPPREARLGGFSTLGMFPDILAAFEPALARSGGMVVVAGSPESDVPRTLCTLLNRINHGTGRAVTIEDPVVYLLPRVTQIAVDATAGLAFSDALRLCLRDQLDSVMLSHLPDPETASLALQAARSGRKVLAGFPADRAAAVPSDLIAMGVPSYQVASGLAAVLVQHRVRRLCDACKQPDPQSGYYRERLASFHQVWDMYPREEGGYTPGRCAECGHTGYQGHVILFEVLPVTASVRSAILRGEAPAELQETAIREGMITLAADGKRRVDMGEISMEDLFGVLGA